MAEDPVRDFFLQPSCVSQRQYEALGAVFIDGCTQKQAAEQFGYSYDAFRQLVGEFRRACQAGQPPPLLSPNDAADPPLARPSPASP